MSASKRSLDFHTDQEVIDEINRIRDAGYTKSKNWNLTQICEHLTATMRGGMDGFGFRVPWIVRATLMKWMLGRMLKNRKMISGPTLKQLKPTSPPGEDDNEVIEKCIATLGEAANFPGPINDYPLLDNLGVDDWKQLMWLHAAHHLGFLVANDTST